MSARSATQASTLVLAFLLLTANGDSTSDTTIPESHEFSASQIKAETFWKVILNAAEDAQMEKHVLLYADAEASIVNLPTENEYVRKMLQEALEHLKHADDAFFKEALASSCVAGAFSFPHGGKNFLHAALRKFIGGGRYSDRLVEHVAKLQDYILHTLPGRCVQQYSLPPDVAGNIVYDCTLAVRNSEAVQRYDVPKTPQVAVDVPKTSQVTDDLADRLIGAASATKSRLMTSMSQMVEGLARDVQEKQEDAAVATQSLRGLPVQTDNAELPLLISSSGGPDIGAQLIDV